MPRISIIMPIYNKESRIKYSIESVLNQTYKDFELILINDGSTDNCHDIAMKYKNKDARIKYHSQVNQGVSIARNKGIELSIGEYVSFLDSDDELDKSFLEEMLSSIGNHNVCYCGHYYFLGREKKKPKIKFYEGNILEKYIYNKCTPNTNSWLIKRKFLDKHNIRFPHQINWGEDMVFFSKILIHEKDVKCVKKYLTEYHTGQLNSLSENNIDKIEKDIFWMNLVMTYVYDNMGDHKEKANIIKAIRTYRLPGAIIYRLYSNLHEIDKEIIRARLEDLEKYLSEIKFTNGLRTIKLYYIYLRLRLKLR